MHRNVTVERKVAEVDISDVNTQITVDAVEHLLIDSGVIVVHAVEDCTIIEEVVVGNQTQIKLLFDVGRIEEGRIETGKYQLRFDLASHNHINSVVGLRNVH